MPTVNFGKKKTFAVKKEEVIRESYVIEEADNVNGRSATKITDRIRGKDKPTGTTHTNGGNYGVIINAEKFKVTGSKDEDKKYYSHSLYPGGLKTKTFRELNETRPEKIIEEAVKGMLPKNKLGKQMFKKLKIFSGSEHEHESQQPQVWEPKI